MIINKSENDLTPSVAAQDAYCHTKSDKLHQVLGAALHTEI